MPDEPAKPTAPPKEEGSEDADDNERPTVSPPFDPVVFARAAHSRPTPKGGTPVERAPAHAGLATAARPAGGEVRRHTPKTAISLANARIPSNLPPVSKSTKAPPAERSYSSASGTNQEARSAERLESTSSMNAVDREWADIEFATRPPPPDSPMEDPEVEVAAQASIELDDIGLDDEHGADTVRRPVPQEEVKPREREMADRMSLGDYSGALVIAERILGDRPDDLSARTVAETCRSVLRQMYATRIGPLDRVPVVMVPRDQLRWLSIDHKAGFVLSLVDGVSSLEMIIDVSGMPELDTLRILSELAQQRIISLR